MTGFDKLATDEALFGNGDRILTSADAPYGDVRVWIDSNGDGISQATELKTLSDLNITSIDFRTSIIAADGRSYALHTYSGCVFLHWTMKIYTAMGCVYGGKLMQNSLKQLLRFFEIALVVVCILFLIILQAHKEKARKEASATQVIRRGIPVKMSDILPGDWEYVCIVPEYTEVREFVARTLKLNADDLKNSNDLYVDENAWALVFAKHNQFQVFSSISSSNMPAPNTSGKDCVSYKKSSIKFIRASTKIMEN